MTPPEQHVDVGAYVLGVLDPADASRFEAHLNYCETCAAEYDSLRGLRPVLSEFAGSAPDVQSLTMQPSEQSLDRLLGEVSAQRHRSKRRRLYLVAAAAALVIGGPLAGAEAAFVLGPEQGQVMAGEQHKRTDPDTKVRAAVAVEKKAWGTRVGLSLGNVRGPERCQLVAVSKAGEEQTLSTWAVPNWGYGVNGRPELRLSGAAAMSRSDIDRLEVRTLDGDRLVSIPMKT